jgi:hypothetical protein
MTSVLLVLLFAALAAIHLYSRDAGRRRRAWHLLTLLTGRRSAGPGDADRGGKPDPNHSSGSAGTKA